MQLNSITNSSIHCPNWPVQNVQALTTTRHHPFDTNRDLSATTFGAFNLGCHVGDDAHSVTLNRQTLTTLFSSKTKIQWLNQVHGSDVIVVNKHQACPLVGDALITRKKNIAIAIMTADCLPILLADKNGLEVAAIHGGWRPLANNIIANTLDKMMSDNHNIIAWLGPCISQDVFEVGDDVKKIFDDKTLDFKDAFIPRFSQNQDDNKYLASLIKIASLQLANLGITDIRHLSHCTFKQSDDYYSYRRDGQTGRMATIICRI